MTALFAYRRLVPAQAISRSLILLAALVTAPARAADTITVTLDQATIIKMPEHVTTLVVGNPLIADVSTQPGGLLVVTGKGYGTTNLIELDHSGAVLAERNIEVRAPEEQLVHVFRGPLRESYSCTPDCEPRLMLGDDQAHFNGTLQQTGTRASVAQGMAGASQGPAQH
jgi:Flp pilus assembly secretin CpaC